MGRLARDSHSDSSRRPSAERPAPSSTRLGESRPTDRKSQSITTACHNWMPTRENSCLARAYSRPYDAGSCRVLSRHRVRAVHPSMTLPVSHACSCHALTSYHSASGPQCIVIRSRSRPPSSNISHVSESACQSHDHAGSHLRRGRPVGPGSSQPDGARLNRPSRRGPRPWRSSGSDRRGFRRGRAVSYTHLTLPTKRIV